MRLARQPLWLAFVRLYRLKMQDPDLLRAQFDAFVSQLPLLYFTLACNAAAVAVAFAPFGNWRLTGLFPAVLCGFALVRALWWWRRRKQSFTDEQIRYYISNTSRLAVFMAFGFMLWGLQLYPLGDAYARGHLTFFLALTTIGCVCCLMPLPSAALAVATVALLPFVGFFLITDAGHMRLEAVVFGLVGTAMVVLVYRQHRSFVALIESRRDLHLRQLETQKLSDENRRIAFTDALSGLPNRRALLARIDELHADGADAPDQLAMVFIDLDGFKGVNDQYGHEFGDVLIGKVGQRLAAACPEASMLVRMGGDEFAVLVEGARAHGRAEQLAGEIMAALALPVEIDGLQCHIGASIGIAVDADGMTTSYELLRRADAAMYRVKAQSKGGVQVYEASFDAERLHRQRIEQDLRLGLDRGEFDVAYQPIVDALDGRMVAVEALLRWPRRPEGMLAPDDFIDIAEGCGLIHQIGLFVLRRACADMLPHDHLELSVNISPAQFRHPSFAEDVARALRESHFPPHRLQLEITEGYLIDHPERARAAIDAFRAMGVQVALDDFGTGFASIGYLQTYGFTCVKIDRSLVAELGENPRASLLISGMVFMGKGLDLRVVAEGVENERQAAMLRLAGCHGLQGFHFSPPVPIDALWLRGRRAMSC